MRKFILSALILLIAVMGLNAKAVDKSTAEKVALNWINQLDTHKSFSNRIVKTDVNRKDQLSLLYTIHFQNKGFVIVSADDNVEPILGYSLNSKADESQMSPATQAFLNHYASKIDVIVSKKLQNQRANRKWDQLLNTNYQRTDTRDVEPLLMTSWDQGELYNASCPPDPNGPDGHVWAGCVATAMGQIMKYWAYPAQGTGSHYYAHPVYGTLYADFGNTTYNWSEMPNELWEYNTQVSTLLYHLGVSVDMDYGPNGSGAFSEDARDAFVNYFSYSSAASYLYKTDYSDIEWSSLLRSQLDSYKPVYYAGRDASNESGHAFVCDGYSGTDYFHFNWGWSGIYNGYFYLNDLTPGYEGNEADFSYVQRAIVNIEPANPIVNDGILVWEGVSGGSSYSGQYIYNYLQSMQAPSVYTNSFPVSLIGFDAVVLSFGNYGSDISTSFTDEMATRVIDYLNAGGRVYLEGGDALGYDQSDNGTLLSMFGIAESTDGSSLILENLTGQPGSLADSMLFVSSSQAYNGWIDIFTPSSGIVVFKHANGQDVAIQNVMSNGAKTMCFSYALAELNDERNNTRIDLLNRIGLFFGQAAPEGDMYEPDNTYMQAHYIMPGQTQNHSIKPVADVDWVKFDVTEVPQTVIINTDGIGSGDTRLYLYASDGVTELAYNDDYYGLYSSINYTFTEPGTYYAMVDEYGNNNVIEYYTIHLEFQQPEPIIAPSNLVFDLNQINGHVNLEWMHGTSNWVYENFDDGVADNFLGLDDRFSISNGRLIMNGWSNDTWAGTFYNYDFSNFAMEFEITRHQSEGSLTNSMGAFFRANEFSEYTMSGYLFNIVAAGMYSVFVINDNSPVVLIDWTQSEYINTGLGSSNVVTLFAFGPNVDIYINSQYVNSFTDYTFSSGKAGLCTYDSVTGSNQVSWDYFAVEEVSDYRQVTKAKPLTPVFTSGNFKKSPLVSLSERKNNLVQGMTQYTQNRSRNFLYYNLYRNDQYYEATEGTYYTDYLYNYGTYSYYVTAQYTTGESDPSNTVQVVWNEPQGTTLYGYVKNAATGYGIPYAYVSIAGLSTTADDTGYYEISGIPEGALSSDFTASPLSGFAPLGVQFYDLSSDNTHTLYSSADGYVDYNNSHFTIHQNQMQYFDINLSPILTEGVLRFVLTWGADPSDLDSHLLTAPIDGYSHHVYYANRGSLTDPPYANLDVDDTSGYGPETVTINQLYPGTYSYYIYKYSGYGEISTSGALVQAYNPQGLLYSVSAPTSGAERYWHVFNIDGATGQITLINQLMDNPPANRDMITKLNLLNLEKKHESIEKAVQNIHTQRIERERNVIGWYWDFGDGNTSTEQNPYHVYQSPGNYTVQLTTNSNSDSHTITRYDYIQVMPPYTSHFEPVWSGNGYQHMNFYVHYAYMDGSYVQYGDEIAVYDGMYCVGATRITDPYMEYFSIVTSMDDPTTPDIDGYIPGHPVTYRLWRASTMTEYNENQVVAEYLAGQGIFDIGETVQVGLNAYGYYSQNIPLSAGWNIISFNTTPEDMSVTNLYSPLVDNGTLIKVQNESGYAYEYLSFINAWIDYIGTAYPTEGYYVKVNSNTELPVTGVHVPLPLEVPLSEGWNIIGYPYQESMYAMSFFYDLINNGQLVKVMNESGQAIVYLNNIGWIDEIQNFNPGEGYSVKVTQDTQLTYPDYQYPVLTHNSMVTQKKDKKLVRNDNNSHYQTVWSGNGYKHANIYVIVNDYLRSVLQPGDEIAAFDGEHCVGKAIVNGGETYFSLICSMNDGSSEQANGYLSGNPVYISIFTADNQVEYSNMQINMISGDGVYTPGATNIIEIINLLSVNELDIPALTEIKSIYPNPFNPSTNILFSLNKTGKVEVEIFNVKGQKVNTLVSEVRNAGNHQVSWHGKDSKGKSVSSGIYFCSLKTPDKQMIRKMILMK